MSHYELGVSVWKEASPIRLAAENWSDLPRLIEICKDEIVLIARKIENSAIPFPSKIPQKVDQINVAILSPPRETSPPILSDGCTRPLSSEPQAPVGPGWSVGWATKLIATASETLVVARSGPIVVSGTGWRAYILAMIFRLARRKVIHLASGYGDRDWIVPGYLRRPAENSFLAWLLLDAVPRLKRVGALVLTDDVDGVDDLAALSGLEYYTPPILLRAEVASVAGVDVQGGRDCVALSDGMFRGKPCPPPTQGSPKISIVTVSFNQSRYLEAALRSVLDQNYPNLEYIVVDGGSTDGSVDIIEKYRSRLSHAIIEPDEGQSDALNKGFRLATGEIMNWLCSDDLLEPGALFRVADLYRRFEPDLIAGGCVRIGETRTAEILRHHSALPVGRPVPLSLVDMLQFMHSWQSANYFFQPEVFFSRRAGKHPERL